MHPLNPFLRAFFRSTVPGQCVPIQNHVLLVPTTECLIDSRDRDTSLYYSDLASSEEFLGSHVLRISNPAGLPGAKEGSSARESRGKAKQVTTVNGRTVIIKESFVYSNKGFKTLSQVQILSDVLYYTHSDSSQPWLIYYISKPLIGTFDPGKIPQAVVPGLSPKVSQSGNEVTSSRSSQASPMQKKEIKTFLELLASFPMIARQMQPGLERLFREFGKELGTPLPPPPSRSPSESSHNDRRESTQEVFSVGRESSPTRGRLPFNSAEFFEDDEDLMRRALETAVTAAIDLFRLVDKQQLSLLGATTDLTGPLVERLIERYISEQVHEPLLFPRLCSCREQEDSELDSRIRQMENIDVSQCGIAIEGGRGGKKELIRRLGRGVETFRKMAEAKGPHEMLEVLLATIKMVTIAGPVPTNPVDASSTSESEKQPSALTVNADILVSLLLLVVIRSHVRHLQARLLYMQQFIYIDDVESGEMGYALSTFEAVLTYLQRDSVGLRRASARNRALWSATKNGRISDMKAILEPDASDGFPDHNIADDTNDYPSMFEANEDRQADVNGSFMNGTIFGNTDLESTINADLPQTPTLAHVFPFQAHSHQSPPKNGPKRGKKVSMDMSSISGSSVVSFLSRTTTLNSTTSGIEGDTSIENLTQTQDPAGDSVPMMAVEGRQPEALKYLLSLEEYYPITSILEDTNSDGTTLLSAAIQLAHTELVDAILDYILHHADKRATASYFAKADIRGRTMAHYLFSTPSYVRKLSTALPWRQKDKNGQTPLFALCRSYDHPHYNAMVNEALQVAEESQGDGQPLRLEDHVDSKGNTLLHIVSDPQIILRILRECDCDPNATNDKKFTPLMMASKYGRVDLVRTLFADPRVDVHLKELRGLTAIELAKDDEVRNRIDDLILFSNPPVSSSLDPLGRVTTVVRSFFVEDMTVRFVLKSGAPNPLTPDQKRSENVTFTVTTCRRSLVDFENLAKWLALEHPASYIPDLGDFRAPFQIHSKPSRAVLHDMQERLDRFLKILLAHPTFGTHELLWEFFLVPELQTDMVAERSSRKAVALSESITDDYEPITQDSLRDVEQFVSHAQEMVRAISANTRSLIKRGRILHFTGSDFADAVMLASNAISTLQAPTNALPASHIDAFARYAACVSTSSSDSSPLVQYLSAVVAAHSTTTAILSALSRPTNLITSLNNTKRALSRSRSSLLSSSVPRKFNLNFPGLEESRAKTVRDLEQKVAESEAQLGQLGREISWNKDVVVGELAGWTSWREKAGREALKAFVKSTLVREKERGKRLERCLASIREVKPVSRLSRNGTM